MKFTRDLSLGSIGKDVFFLQQCLELLGYDKFIPTGWFLNKTYNAVIKFQIQNQITPAAGYFGIKSRTKMAKILSDINREKIYGAAMSCLGSDVSPDDKVSDEVDCANTVSIILTKALGSFKEASISTYTLYRNLSNSEDFERVDSPLEGDIVISPTGYQGYGGKLSNGHVGIVGQRTLIMSNTSATGKFENNYTLQSWRDRYVGLGTYPMVYFRKL